MKDGDNMVERVARALFKHDNGVEYLGAQHSSLLDDEEMHVQRDRARAAIAAMREPTEAMERAGAQDLRIIGRNMHPLTDTATCVWYGMIDAALKEDGT